jgi:hypothetical protein
VQQPQAQQTQPQAVQTVPVVVHTVVVQVPDATQATTTPETTKPKYTLPEGFTMPPKEEGTTKSDFIEEEIIV